jgi:hypothetical protein
MAPKRSGCIGSFVAVNTRFEMADGKPFLGGR